MGILSRSDRFLAVTALITFLFFASQLGALGSRERVTSSGRVFDPEKRLFGGPGSSPPTCRSKCGRCFPCRAVHVAIQPGMSIPLEYYPEAWRCKCGNKLYMP